LTGDLPGNDDERDDTERTGDVEPASSFDLWTFQTAFRWLHPSVPASGYWSRALENFLPAARDGGTATIDRQLWDDVMAIRIGTDGPLAVYRPPWQTALAPDFAASEADLAELVVPAYGDPATWTAYALPSTVEILLHHRDSRAVPAGDAWATLLWRSFDVPRDRIDADTAGILAYLTGTGDPPADWRVLRQQLTVPLDARLPRAVAIDVDLSGQTPDDTVLFLAYVDSAADDQPRRPPSIESPKTLTDLIRSWPSLAARKVLIVSSETTDDVRPGAGRWQRPRGR
jgi:hypothetical protein